jgi:transposase
MPSRGSAEEIRSLLTARKLIQGKLLELESGIRAVMRGFNLKVGPISRGRFETRILELVSGQSMLETVIGSMLSARTALQTEFARLHRSLLTLARADPVCQRLMSVPGVGALLEGQHEALTQAAIAKALEGDNVALRLCLNRIALPARMHLSPSTFLR